MKKYKSKLEESLATSELKEYDYEPVGSGVDYQILRIYFPDFIHPDQPNVLVEAKGYFRDGFADCKKYLSVIRDNKEKELVFIFPNPEKKAYGQCKKRADGTYLSLGEWCKSHNILYFKVGDVPIGLSRGELSVDDLRAFKETLFEEI